MICRRPVFAVAISVWEEFQVEYGVKQGDPLSATLFSMVIDVILKNLT
jgi:hypothetical protein